MICKVVLCVLRSSPNAQSQILAIEGMLSMSRGSRDSSLFAPLSRGVCKPGRLQPSVKDEEEQLMADCYQDGEYSKLLVSLLACTAPRWTVGCGISQV